MPVSANITQLVSVSDRKSGDLSDYSGSPQINHTHSLTTSDVGKCFADSATISTVTNIDLTSGLTDAYGNALVFASVKALQVKVTSVSGTLTVGGGTNAFSSDQFTVSPGCCVTTDSTYVIDGTHKIVKLNPSASLTYSIIIVGT